MLSQLINTAERTTIPLERIKTDGGTQMRAALDPDTVQEYLDAMQPIGWGDFPAVIVYYDGKDHWLADGFHRVEAYRRAADNLDQPASVPADVRSGTRRDAILHAAGANASHGLRRTNADKRRAVGTLLRDDDWRHWSNREIGRRCNVSESFVREVKKDLGIDTAHETQYIHPKTGEPTTMHTTNIGAKPVETDEERRQRIRENDRLMKDEINSRFAPPPPARFSLSTDDLPDDLLAAGWTVRSKELGAYWVVNENHGFESAVVRGWDNFTELCATLQKRLPSHAKTVADAMASAISNQQSPISNYDPDVAANAEAATVQIIEYDAAAPLPEWAEEPDDEEPPFVPVSLRDDYDSDEWYTPADYIEAARRAMGSIDLDPATCEMAQTIVQADVYLTKMDNGLAAKWLRETVWLNPPYSNSQAWIDKLLREVDGVFVKQAIVLVNNATETAWFQSLLARSAVVCFPGRRLQFWRHDHSNVGARQGQAIFYIGPNDAAFIAEFEQFGTLMRRVM